MSHALLITAVELPNYATTSDFVSGFTSDELAAVLQGVTDECLGYMKPEKVPPLVSWGADIRLNAGHIAVARLHKKKGMAPPTVAVGDGVVIDQEQLSIAWFKGIGTGDTIVDVEDSSTADDAGVGFAGLFDGASDCKRGW